MTPSITELESRMALKPHLNGLDFLRNYRVQSVNVDFPRLFKTTFQELLFITLLGFLTTLVDHWVTPYENTNCACKLIAPVLFLTAIIGIKTLETGIAKSIFSWLGIRYSGCSSEYRVLQKVIILLCIIVLNAVKSLTMPENIYPDASLFARTDFLGLCRDFSMKIIGFWLHFSMKFIGICAVITYFRLNVDTAIYSYKLLEAGFKKDDKPKKIDVNPTPDENDNVNRLATGDNSGLSAAVPVGNQVNVLGR